MDLRTLEDLLLTYRESTDPQLLTEVYDRTAVKLLMVASHLCGSASEAEDIVQATFLGMLESIDRWNAERQVMPWLLGILANRVKRANRAKKRQVDPNRLSEFRSEEPLDLLEAIEFSREIDEKLSRLPKPYQTVLVLRLKHGMGPAAIAEVLRRPQSTVRCQLTRGLEMLRKAIPASFVAGLFVMATPSRGLAMVRAHVIEQGGGQALTTGILASRKLTWLSAVAAVLAVTTLGLLAINTWSKPSTILAADQKQTGSNESEARKTPASQTNAILAAEREPHDRLQSRAQTSGSLVVRVRHATAPAAGTNITIEPVGKEPIVLWTEHSRPTPHTSLEPLRSQPILLSRRRVTDSQGTCRFPDMAPGYWAVHQPGQSSLVHIAAGEESILDIADINRAVGLRGVVVDDLGHPIPDAEIWVSHGADVLAGDKITTTDTWGRFTAVVADRSFVVARAPGRAPASIRTSYRPDESYRDVRIQLAGAGGDLRGTVRDERGRRIANAVVQVGHALDSFVAQTKGSSRPWSAAPARIKTDQNGDFELRGITPGLPIILARAQGFGTTSSEARIIAGELTEVELRLPACAVVHGKIIDGHGQAVTGTQVHVSRRGEFDFVSTMTDADGNYQLRDLTAGRIRLVAGNGDNGFTHTVIETRPGEVSEWNPKLTADSKRITGRVRDQQGAPMPNALVQRRTGTISQTDWTYTDTSGRFSFDIDRADLEIMSNIRVFRNEPVPSGEWPSRFPLAFVQSVATGSTDLDIRILDKHLPSAWLSGHITDELGEGWQQRAFLKNEKSPDQSQALFETIADPEDPTAFTAGPLPPGYYWIGIDTREIGPFLVPPRAQINLGDLRITPKKGLQKPWSTTEPLAERSFAFLHPDDGSPISWLFLKIYDAEDRLVINTAYAPASRGWQGRVKLPIGKYRIEAKTPAGLLARRELAIPDREQQHYAIRIPLGRE